MPIHLTPHIDLESQATSFDNYVHPCRLSDSGNGVNGFMLISDGAEVTDSFSKNMEVYTYSIGMFLVEIMFLFNIRRI